MQKSHRKTIKAQRARETVAALLHVEIERLRDDFEAVTAMYADLEDLGIQWDAKAQEWQRVNGSETKDPQVETFVFGVLHGNIDDMANMVIEALELAGHKVVASEFMLDIDHPQASMAKVSVLR